MSINFLTFYLAVGTGARSSTGHRAKLLNCSRACPQICTLGRQPLQPPSPSHPRAFPTLCRWG